MQSVSIPRIMSRLSANKKRSVINVHRVLRLSYFGVSSLQSLYPLATVGGWQRTALGYRLVAMPPQTGFVECIRYAKF